MASDQEEFSSVVIYGSIKLYSRILFWNNLTELNLGYYEKLIETPDFSELPNLRRLNLRGCEALVDLHASIGQHKKLQLLNLEGCKNLRSCGPKKLEMSALEAFVLGGCIQINFLPEFGESMQNLEMLDVGETNIVKLPNSLGLLIGLLRLNIRDCRNLVSLPQSISNLERLKFIDISGCSKLTRFPENFKEIEDLEVIDESETAITEVPSSFIDFEKPKIVSLRGHERKTWKYDIFLSFSGLDTRRGFTSYLYRELDRSRFRTFIDDEELCRGEVISQTLLRAIEESHFAIVILSKNYASSSWCLDELQHILASRDRLGQIVLPIFYYVDPSDVRKQRNSFGEAFAQLAHRFKQDQRRVQNWSDSLTDVANLSGFHSQSFRTEAELIEEVVRYICTFHSELSPVSGSEELIGIEWRVEEMLEPLRIGFDDVRFIGIWGMGGVGKTTLARALHEKFRHQFPFHCFLDKVRVLSEKGNGLVDLQNELLSHLNIKAIKIKNEHQGKNTLGRLFSNRKVMLILDDVNDISQLQNLAGSHEWFGDGSRIIITTRDAALLRSHEVDEIHEVKPMNHYESLQLFSQIALGGDPPTKSLLGLANSAISYANGLPLALRILGSLFSKQREINEWEQYLDILKKDSNNGIFKILRLSYEALNHVEKTIFLDIACFFDMWGKDEVKQIIASCGLEATIGMKNLIDKSLLVEIELGNIKYIHMHDLVQEMGRHIVSDESPYDVGKRSRLWTSDDIDEVLNEDLGTRETEGVILPFTFAKDEACWDPASFLKMRLLRLLVVSCNFNLPLGLEGFPSIIKVFHWYGYPFEALPPRQKMNRVLYLKMQNSKIKQLSIDEQSMSKLQILDLSHSQNLVQTPSFLGFQNLRRLDLEGCTSLVEIHSSFGQLPFLVEANLKDCLNLKVIPKTLEINSLEVFVLGGCIQLRNLPQFGEQMVNLRTLDVKETCITKLPKSLGSLTGIETLDLQGCQNLVGLPHNIHKLKSLKVLDISGCSAFLELPENLNENEALEKLDASGTAIAKVPSSVCCLKNITTLSFHGCKKPTSNSSILFRPWRKMFQRHLFPKGLALPSSIFNIESLTELDLSYCNIVDGIIPNDLSGLSSLQKLDLSGNEFVNLPHGCISNLINLRSFYLNSCPKLQFLPQPSPGLNLMDAGECSSLRTLSDKKLLHLFASIEQDGQHDEGLRNITKFSVTVPGSVIPSWFDNHNHLLLDEKHVASLTIDIPEGEWLGIGLCTLIDDNICCPRWGFDFKASDGKYVSLPGRTREHEKEIKSSHLWIMFWKIKEGNRDELSKKYNQIRLKFCTDWVQHPSTSVEVDSIKCGLRFIHKWDLEPLMDEENIFIFEEEQRQCNWLQGETSQTIIRGCEETMPSETTTLSSEDEVALDDSWRQLIADDARYVML